MSEAALRKPAQRPQPQPDAPTRRSLVDLPRLAPRRGPKIAHGVVAMTGLGAIVAAQLFMSMGLSGGAYELQSLRIEHAQAERGQQALNEHLGSLQSPQNLATSAEALGMASGEHRHYIELETGTVTAGPDALHIDSSARTGRSARLAVPNELVQSERDLSAIRESRALDAQRQREAAGYPGMLLPPQGVADQG